MNLILTRRLIFSGQIWANDSVIWSPSIFASILSVSCTFASEGRNFKLRNILACKLWPSRPCHTAFFWRSFVLMYAHTIHIQYDIHSVLLLLLSIFWLFDNWLKLEIRTNNMTAQRHCQELPSLTLCVHSIMLSERLVQTSQTKKSVNSPAMQSMREGREPECGMLGPICLWPSCSWWSAMRHIPFQTARYRGQDMGFRSILYSRSRNELHLICSQSCHLCNNNFSHSMVGEICWVLTILINSLMWDQHASELTYCELWTPDLIASEMRM